MGKRLLPGADRYRQLRLPKKGWPSLARSHTRAATATARGGFLRIPHVHKVLWWLLCAYPWCRQERLRDERYLEWGEEAEFEERRGDPTSGRAVPGLYTQRAGPTGRGFGL